ncbi:MAG: hypothetical protein LC723_06430 [Actinobacteria bacterium]|nr:hypothetical protein [Actinomycetota bacterium]
MEVTTGKIQGLRNWKVDIPGSTVTAYLGQWDDRPYEWAYSLWVDDDTENVDIVSSGTLDMSDTGHGPVKITPDQAARIAFLLDVEYP